MSKEQYSLEMTMAELSECPYSFPAVSLTNYPTKWWKFSTISKWHLMHYITKF